MRDWKVFVFDFDGVLVDSYTCLPSIYKHIARLVGLRGQDVKIFVRRAIKYEDEQDAIGNYDRMSWWPSLFKEFNISLSSVNIEKLLRELAELNFLREGKNIVFVGPPGVGKTHLAVALGIKAAKARKRVLFYTAEGLINDLISAEVSNHLATLLDSLSRIDLLIVDELGYLELTRASASLFFRFISKRYEKTSTIITSNKPFEEWGEIFNDDVVASAILDRILHHCYPFFIQGKSYRTKELIGNRKK